LVPKNHLMVLTSKHKVVLERIPVDPKLVVKSPIPRSTSMELSPRQRGHVEHDHLSSCDSVEATVKPEYVQSEIIKEPSKPATSQIVSVNIRLDINREVIFMALAALIGIMSLYLAWKISVQL